MNTASNSQSPPRTFLAMALFGICMVTGMAAVEFANMPSALRIGLALLAPLAFLYLIWQWRNGVRQMDELERRIQLEALAIAFPLSVLLVLTLGMLQRVIHLPFEDFSYRHLWAMLIGIYFCSVAIARKRYG